MTISRQVRAIEPGPQERVKYNIEAVVPGVWVDVDEELCARPRAGSTSSAKTNASSSVLRERGISLPVDTWNSVGATQKYGDWAMS